LIGIALNMYVSFGSMAIFTKLILPIYEHGKSLGIRNNFLNRAQKA
jgi:hypothetical protein